MYDDICPGCGDGDKVPAKGYWRCPVCDAEWFDEEENARWFDEEENKETNNV